MASRKHEPKPFPVDIFVQQYRSACHADIHASRVQARALRSRKHATAEVSIPRCIGPGGSRAQDIVIAKYFESRERALLDHEHAVLSHATSAGIPVPRVLHDLDNFLVLERVDGRTLMDVINDAQLPIEGKQDAIGKLGAWLRSFHVAFACHPKVRCRGDANLRNFVVTIANVIVGLDFEEASMTDPTHDLHEVIDSILQSDPGILTNGQPSIEWKYGLCEWLLRCYANAAGIIPAVLYKDATSFVEAQLQITWELASIRGSLHRITPFLPGIKNALERVMERLHAVARMDKVTR